MSPVIAEKRALVEEVRDTTGKIFLPPCQVACPIGENIQRTNVLLSRLPSDIEDARPQILDIGDAIYEQNPLFAVCSYVCGLCERKCNYGDKTGAIRRKMLKRFIASYYLPYLKTKPSPRSPRGKKVAVIGGGPGGLMCAQSLSKRGYRVTILERTNRLGGALRYIPRYRLPSAVMDATMESLVRLSNIEVRYGVDMGTPDETLSGLEKEGFKAAFIATGTNVPRPLTFGPQLVEYGDLRGVMFGLRLLDDAHKGKCAPDQFRHQRVVVVGGGNVAFDVARTVRRLGGKVQVVCLECEDKKLKDGIPADTEEIEGAQEEGIVIHYSRGVQKVIGEGGQFRSINCPRCTAVFDEKGFNPRFDTRDVIDIDGDVLMITIGQGGERTFFQREDLLDERGRFDIDPVTLMSNRLPGIFIGGDIRRVGFAAEAMRDGLIATESIDRYLKGENLKSGRTRDYEGTGIPNLISYKPQPEVEWAAAEDRMNFDLFEKDYSLTEVVQEARRCLCCGPCQSCKACVELGFQDEIRPIEVNQDACSGCGTCSVVCNYEAISLVQSDDGIRATLNPSRCKRCGVCIAACPSGAIDIEQHDTREIMAEIEGVLI